jgi:glycosyltransferase involved in cell wall biosynthesis
MNTIIDDCIIGTKITWLVNVKTKILELDTKSYSDDKYYNIFDIIHNYTKCLHVFTTDSILRALTHIADMSDEIETFLTMNTLETLRECISEYLKIMALDMNFVSKIDDIELSFIQKKLSESNISLRQVFSVNYGAMETILVSKVLEIFQFANLNNLMSMYSRINVSNHIDLINDLYRPIESTVNELPICVIIPSYNNIKTINVTLASIHRQTYANYRVIFIDDVSDDPIEIDNVLNMSKKYNQDSKYLIVKQYIKQRQCAGRYIGYHMAYDDEIILFLDGDDMFYNEQTMCIVNNAYNNGPIAITYGSHVDLYCGKIKNICKGCENFPIDIIKNKMYRYYKFLSAHLRTGYAYLFKNIHVTDLIHNDGNFFKIMTDYAEMIPALEMITPDNMNNTQCDNLPYLKVIKEPLYIYNMDNSLNYKTSFARRNDQDNIYYNKYRNDATMHIRSMSKYAFTLKNKNYKHTTSYYLMLMKNYQIDVLIIDTSSIKNNTNVLIQKFYANDCLHLTGHILNNKLNHSFELGDYTKTLNQICLKAIIVPCKQITNDYNNLQQNYYLISSSNINKQIEDSNETICVVGYMDLS